MLVSSRSVMLKTSFSFRVRWKVKWSRLKTGWLILWLSQDHRVGIVDLFSIFLRSRDGGGRYKSESPWHLQASHATLNVLTPVCTLYYLPCSHTSCCWPWVGQQVWLSIRSHWGYQGPIKSRVVTLGTRSKPATHTQFWLIG